MKQIKPLSIKQIDTARPADKPYRLYDGFGLSLLVKPTAKIWHFSYQKPISRKRTIMSLGAYPVIGLAEARQKRDEYRKLLAQNIDPQAHAKEQNNQQKSIMEYTFYKVSCDWIAEQNYKPNTLDSANRYLRYAYPFIGDKPVASLTVFDILDICQAIYEKHGSLMASGVKNKIAQVLDFALVRRMVVQNVARGLVNTHKKHKHGNHPAITNTKEFAKFLQRIERIDDCGFVMASYIQLAPYLFVRPSELESMHINQIDFDECQWKYTPQKTEYSTEVQMIVPLSTQVMSKIKVLLAWHGQEYVFFSNRGKKPHISHQRANEWLRNNGFSGIQTMHGLRASAKTILEEVLEYDPRFVEMQLGHTVQDMNGTAYNRAKFIKQRTEMMQSWSDYLDELKKTA